MNRKQVRISILRLSKSLGIVALFITACTTQFPESCADYTPVGLSSANEIASDQSLPFQFPLEVSSIDDTLYYGWFSVSNQCPPDMKNCYEYPERKFHAAEDYKRPPGTPVYAIADGIIRYSGPEGGYGWLIIIDHPQANLYSLYGHLSPSRWKLKVGTEVERGSLIAYLGDPDENGGSEEQPLVPHLHFGIRAGQKRDYPAKGEWRYMAGWIRLCPEDVGWLNPSVTITNQEIPKGGFPQPEVGFLTRWGTELLLTLSYIIGGVLLIFGSRKKKRFILLIPGILTLVLGVVFYMIRLMNSYMLLAAGIINLAVGIYYFIRWPIEQKNSSDQNTKPDNEAVRKIAD